MKAVCISEFVKNYDEIKVSDVPRPQPKEDEVLVRIAAAGVNFVDLLYARGKHQNNRSLVTPPFILGLEFAGTITSCPQDCGFSVGDRVFGGALGSYSSEIAVKPAALHRIPASWSFREAAGFGATATVSYGALIIRANLQKGETVLIHAAAGGLGLMAVQIAKAIGARVIATAGSEEKLEVARKFGADECVNYSNKDWYRRVLELTNGRGVEIVYDSVGLVDKSLKCLKHKGKVLVIGFAGTEGNLEKIATNRILLKQAQIIGYRWGESDRRFPEETAEVWRGLGELLQKGFLKPTVFERHYSGLQSVVAAMKDLSQRQVWGKAVIDIGAEAEKPRL
ncbi:hypothetical protein BP6252_07201 [Coleophoma cylindrospora]|uniref:Enoyl reductase (ER) domain-containing protein n=1 Tax=Coleophoma cylindrospora TaxID=1849047 RepID=A0A3D8RHC7_9HELO|nr:hypothetical protein BP6252_07201 [Coleophoma cylindrospora]